MFVIPTAIGLLIDLVLIVPIPLSLDEVSVITLQCWVLGWLFLVTLVGLVSTLPSSCTKAQKLTFSVVALHHLNVIHSFRFPNSATLVGIIKLY